MKPWMSALATSDGLIVLTKNGKYVTRLMPEEAFELVVAIFQAAAPLHAVPSVPGIEFAELVPMEAQS